MSRTKTMMLADVDDRTAASPEYLLGSPSIVLYKRKPVSPFQTSFVSHASKNLWGYEPEAFLNEGGFWLDHIHEQDLKQVSDGITHLLKAGSGRLEYRFRVKAGDYRWVRDEASVVRDSAGTAIELAGYCLDITASKTLEARLHQSDSLSAKIFDGTSDLQALFRIDPGNRFTTESLNRSLIQSFRAASGRDAREYIGKPLEDLLAATGLTESEIESRRSLYLKVIHERRTIRFETPMSPLRDAVEISVSPIEDQLGNCTHILWSGRSVSERVRAEAALRESEERYALVTQATHDGIFDWNFVTGESYLSPRYKGILGFRDDELPNDTSSFLSRIHPDDSARLNNTMDRIRTDRKFNLFVDELRLRCKDGQYRWVASRGQVVRNADGEPVRIVGSVGDITDRRRAATRLAASEKRLRDILDSLLGFVGLFALDGRVIEANQASLEFTGLDRNDILGRPIWDTFWYRHDPQEQEKAKDMLSRVAQGEVVRCETAVQVLGGHLMMIDATFSPLRDEHGVIQSIIGFGMDITRRKEAEDKLLVAKQLAEASSRAKSEFLANMSHEIRTPMNGILGLTEVVLDSDLTEEQREYLKLVKTSAESLLAIISDVLDISNIQAGKFLIKPKEFWVRELVDGMLKRFSRVADEKGLSLRWSVQGGVPDVMLGDASCVRQVLDNLVGNAIKFTPAGEVEVTVETESLQPGTLHIRVRDTGIGVSEDKQQMIFEPFSQVDGSHTREFGGTGLGLAISAQLAEMMGGRLWVESDGKTGSTFHFTARLQPVRSSPSEFRSAEAAGEETHNNIFSNADRRGEQRVDTDQLALIKRLEPFAATHSEVRVLDLSPTGMKLRVDESLTPGTLIEIHRNNEKTIAEVRYCLSADTGYHIGIKIL